MERKLGSAVMAEAHGTSRLNSSTLPARFRLCSSGTSVSLLQGTPSKWQNLGVMNISQDKLALVILLFQAAQISNASGSPPRRRGCAAPTTSTQWGLSPT